ncbi:MAG: ATP-dependent DNA helicase RecG [Lachnospiraceae bacterium]|nr:ATP-dependent DNA helicase RecG [Lachnospiraceae bacterium]
MNLSDIKGIGPKTEKLFNKAGVYSVDDLLKYYPKNYDIFEEPVLVNDLENDRVFALKLTVTRHVEIKRVRNLIIVNAILSDATGNTVRATWFNAPYLKNTLVNGSSHIFRGFIKVKNGAYILEQPKIYTEEAYKEKMGEMQPVYPLVKGLTNNIVQKSVRDALESLGRINDYLPEEIANEYDLETLSEAIYNIHYPKSTEQVIKARGRLVFDEFFSFVYMLRMFKEDNGIIENKHKLSIDDRVEDFVTTLPYQLTRAQENAWMDIKKDFMSDRAMNRLIQGDVGSGKTIVAILALLNVAFHNLQGAIMVPTEVLARQHFDEISNIIASNGYDFNAVLLTGSMTAKEKRETYASIKNDDSVRIIVGTHAIFQENVEYKKLALVITDEQHRFGVKQRQAISQKGDNPHVIVMSATPIPRTLAIILYGDLDISVIDELPANRLPIKNCVVGNEYRPNAYRFMEKQIQQGRQIYIICPSVEYSEAVEGENVIDYSDKLKKIFPPSVKINYLHGKMKNSEKNEIIDSFAKNETQILVSTTVVEVGVNVPNATVMMIENSERFGLAALHQLRGRVGRGGFQSYCIFVNGSKKKDASKRLDILAKSNDGFKISSEDLKLRGPGDFFGIRQSGDMEFKIGDVYTDSKILKQADDAVKKIESHYFNLDEVSIEELNKSIKSMYNYGIDDNRINI